MRIAYNSLHSLDGHEDAVGRSHSCLRLSTGLQQWTGIGVRARGMFASSLPFCFAISRLLVPTNVTHTDPT
jgi:hypothetical protein